MRPSISFLLLAMTTSCSNPEANSIGDGRVNEAGAVQILAPKTEQFSADRLARIIGGVATAEHVPANPSSLSQGDDAENAVARLDDAMVRFGSIPTPTATAQMHLRDRRNEIQGQLITASNNRCNAYKIYLRRLSSNTQFGLGSIATVLGGVGALVTGGAANALSGAAAITTGVNAEFQRDVLSSVTTSVIIPGIETQRSALLQDIADRRCLSLGSYALSTAISDVIKYHGACSADVGIAAAGQAVSQVRYNSLDVVKSTLSELSTKEHTQDSGQPTPKGSDQGQTQNRNQSTNPSLLLGQPVTLHDCPSLDATGLELATASTSKPDQTHAKP